MGTKRTWIGTELNGDSEDDTVQSNININKTREVGSSTSSKLDNMACYLATPVTNSNNTNEVPSQDKNNQTSSTVNDLKTPYEDLP